MYKMDSHVNLHWFRANLIDNRWRQEVLPPGEAEVPLGDLPELDSGEHGPSVTPKQIDQKWSDAGLGALLTLAQ